MIKTFALLLAFGLVVTFPAYKVRAAKSDCGQKLVDGTTPPAFNVSVGTSQQSYVSDPSFRLDSLAPGSYELELTATDSAGKQVTRTAAFDVR